VDFYRALSWVINLRGAQYLSYLMYFVIFVAKNSFSSWMLMAAVLKSDARVGLCFHCPGVVAAAIFTTAGRSRTCWWPLASLRRRQSRRYQEVESSHWTAVVRAKKTRSWWRVYSWQQGQRCRNVHCAVQWIVPVVGSRSLLAVDTVIASLMCGGSHRDHV